MNDLDTGEFDLDLSALENPEAAAQTPAIIVDAIDDDPPELDLGEFVFVGWQADI